MNERIKELLGQAYDEAVPETWTTLSSEQLGRIYEKFAELIVRECADIAKHHVMNISTYSDAEFVEKQILENFGVE